jgi:hypothetical protein
MRRFERDRLIGIEYGVGQLTAHSQLALEFAGGDGCL